MMLAWQEVAALAISSLGVLVYLFLMVIIIGYRRPRRFERVLFFLALALFLCYAGLLLTFHAELYFQGLLAGIPSAAAGMLLAAIGVCALPGLIRDAHVSYMRIRPQIVS